MKRLALITSVTFILYGCTAGIVNQTKKLIGNKPYQDSTSELTSNIRVQIGDNFSVHLYPNGCMTSMQSRFLLSPEVESINILGGQLKFKSKSLNMPFKPEKIETAEFKVPSERFIALSAYKNWHTGTEMRGCSVDAIYKFVPNTNYELLNETSERQCSLVINEILDDGKRVELKPLKTLHNVNEWAGCEAQLKGL